MKHLIVFLIALCSISPLLAQPLAQHKTFLTSLLQQASTNEDAMKTTAIKDRVIAQSTFDNTAGIPIKTDSFNLVYSLSRGSAYDYNMMFFPYNYPYTNSPMFNYKGLFTKPQVLYDTCLHWTADPFTLVYGFNEKTYCSYNANNYLTQAYYYTVDSALSHNMEYINTFNTAGNITSGYWFNLNLGVADSAFKQFFTYNGSNKLTMDSTYQYIGTTWTLVQKAKYTYNAAGNLTQIDYYSNAAGTMQEQMQYINSYDATNRLLTVLTSYSSGSSMLQYVKDTFAYSAAGINFHTSWKEYLFDSINHYWTPSNYMTKHLNTLNLPDTVYIQKWDSLANNWLPQTKDVVTYNTLNMPVQLLDYEYGTASYPATPTYTTNYYYEQYTATQVDNHAVQNSSVKVYPNPTNNNITLSGLPQNTGVYITLINAQGQTVRTITTPNINDKINIPLADLKTGIYWLTVQNKTGALLHQQTIVKE